MTDAEQLAAVLPCTCNSPEIINGVPWHDWGCHERLRPAILALLADARRETIKECAALCAARGDWREGAGEFLAMQIRALPAAEVNDE